MRVLVTGATAPLGAAIVRGLLAQPDVTLVLAIGRDAAAPDHDSRLVARDVDLSRARAVHDLIHGVARELAIDTVIHTAQHRGVLDTGHGVHAENVESTRELVRNCANHPTIRRLVYHSFAEVYANDRATPSIVDEDAPLEFDPELPQWLRDRVEADLVMCAFHGPLEIIVLRCAELLAPGTGSQLWDYLSSRVCLRPAGFDPIINVLGIEDATDAFVTASRSSATGVFNIPGADTLPLSRAIDESHRTDVPIPGFFMSPLYALRRAVVGFEFRYDLNARRFHVGGVLDGTRARRELGYVPHTPVRWPRPWWLQLFERLADL